MRKIYDGISENVTYTSIDNLKLIKIKDYDVLINQEMGGWAQVSKNECEQLTKKNNVLSRELGKKAYEVGLAKRNGSLIFDKSKIKLSPGVLYFFEFNLSNACNLKCVYCSNETCTEEIKQPDVNIGKKWIDRICEYVKEKKVPHVALEFTGGEPLVNVEFISNVLRYAKKKLETNNISYAILFATNLTVLGDKQLQMLKEFNPSIQVSLDGPKYVHDMQRPFPNGKGSFDTVIRNLNILKENGIEIHAISSVVTGMSVDYLTDISKFLLEQEYFQMTLQPIQSIGRGMNVNLKLDANKYVDKLFETIDTVILPYWIKNHESMSKNHKKFHIRMAGLMFSFLLEPWRNYMCQRCPCGNSSTIISVDAYGNVYGCNQAPFNDKTRLGNIKDNSFIECQNTENSRVFRERSLENIEECSQCEFKVFCQGGCPKSALSINNTINSPGDSCELNKKLFKMGMEKIIEKAYPTQFMYSIGGSFIRKSSKLDN